MGYHGWFVEQIEKIGVMGDMQQFNKIHVVEIALYFQFFDELFLLFFSYSMFFNDF